VRLLQHTFEVRPELLVGARRSDPLQHGLAAVRCITEKAREEDTLDQEVHAKNLGRMPRTLGHHVVAQALQSHNEILALILVVGLSRLQAGSVNTEQVGQPLQSLCRQEPWAIDGCSALSPCGLGVCIPLIIDDSLALDTHFRNCRALALLPAGAGQA
jgi:hypothetical protein